MRVLLSIHHPLTPDLGAPGVTYQMREHFEARGDKAAVLSFTDMPRRPFLQSEIAAKLRFPWFVARRLSQLSSQLDVADCSSGDGWVYQALRPERKLLMVARSHGLEHIADRTFRHEVAAGRQAKSWKYLLYHGGFRLWEVARSFRTADLSIFLNRGDREYAIANLGVTPERSATVPNGIPDRFIGLRDERDRPQRPGLRVALVGSYGHRKINVAPKALNRALALHPEMQIGFLGTGVPEATVLADYEPAFHSRIRVMPRFAHTELPQLLRDYDVLLFPSLAEGFGLVVYEAMACGLAVIATELDALKDYMTNEQQVLFIPPGDADAIVAALDRMAVDLGLRAHLQKNGWDLAQGFAWSAVADTTAALYKEHLARKRIQASRER